MICRLCAEPGMKVVLDLGHHPLADRFLTPAMLDKPEITYPLRVALCGACGYLGLTHVVPEAVRYQTDEYSYTAGNSAVSRAHFDQLAIEVALRVPRLAGQARLAVDIGGNDGTFLQAIARQTGCRVLNVEAAPNIAAMSRAAGVPTARYGIWGEDAVDDIRDRGGADLIVATNVFNHASEPVPFLEWVALALAPGGMFVFEVPSAAELVKRGAWDTIYLEHVSYFSLTALVPALADAGLHVEHAEIVEYMGGSLRVWARADGNPGKIEPHVARAIGGEGPIATPEPWFRLHRTADLMRLQLREQLAIGGPVIALGAAAKGNTLINYCRLDHRDLACVVDASPQKIGKFTPGSHIPIVGDDGIPDAAKQALILPWNIASHLRDRYAGRGLTFLVPTANGIEVRS